MKTHTLAVKWGTSRGTYTYGYTTCSLRDQHGNRRAFCNGGGYDMRGTVFGDWLADEYQEQLKVLDPAKFYGLNNSEGVVTIHGDCGYRSVREIAEAIGLEVNLIDADKKLDIITVTEKAFQ
jgi:hypothetical protein